MGGGCDGCELMFEGMPERLDWRTSIGAKDEPGEPLVVRGVIYQRDGKSPAPGVILYVYQTDATGHYAPGPDQTHGRRHGRLRGWMKTDADGRYEFRTIRPAPYPGQTTRPISTRSSRSRTRTNITSTSSCSTTTRS